MVKFKIKYHSIVGVITNSSSELFCQIESDIIDDIAAFIKDEIGIEVDINTYDEPPMRVIQFEMEYGDNEYAQDLIVRLLDKVLRDKFGENNYVINTDVSY